jgi:hypothetical protein
VITHNAEPYRINIQCSNLFLFHCQCSLQIYATGVTDLVASNPLDNLYFNFHIFCEELRVVKLMKKVAVFSSRSSCHSILTQLFVLPNVDELKFTFSNHLQELQLYSRALSLRLHHWSILWPLWRVMRWGHFAICSIEEKTAHLLWFVRLLLARETKN